MLHPAMTSDAQQPTHGPASDSPASEAAARAEERVTINKEFASFDAFVADYVSNISRSGVFIRSEAPLAIDTLVNLRFTVLTDRIETIEGEGRVVRVHTDPPGMGVVFTKLSGYSRQLIERLLISAPSSSAPSSSAPSSSAPGSEG